MLFLLDEEGFKNTRKITYPIFYLRWMYTYVQKLPSICEASLSTNKVGMTAKISFPFSEFEQSDSDSSHLSSKLAKMYAATIDCEPSLLKHITDPLASCLLYHSLRPFIPAYPNMGIAKWLQSDDIGASSLFLATFLFPFSCKQMHPALIEILSCDAIPFDIEDVGRCIRFLEATNTPISDLNSLADKHPRWRPFVNHFSLIKVAYDVRDGQAIYKLLTHESVESIPIKRFI